MTKPTVLATAAALLLSGGCVAPPTDPAPGHHPHNSRSDPGLIPAPRPAEDLTPPEPRQDLTPATPLTPRPAPPDPGPLPTPAGRGPAQRPDPERHRVPPQYPRPLSPPALPPATGNLPPVPPGLAAGCDLALESAPDLRRWCRDLYGGR
ncbi:MULTISPECIES: hypothetical protein [Streptomyces]|uniref:Lipoprotein n=1 Tax=Streptomyces cheonanensis TaxID=312720 RepID=A0ABN2VDM9_9ACTN